MGAINSQPEQSGVSSSGLTPQQVKLFDVLIASVFDSSSLGMLRVNADLTIAFANKKALEICGLSSFAAVSLRSVLADDSVLETIMREFEHRHEGLSSEYEVEVVHHPDGRRIRVCVVGMPILTSDGRLSGAVSIIRSIEIEKQIEVFDRATCNAEGAGPILQAVCEQLGRIAPSDLTSISLYSEDERHARTILRYDPHGHIDVDQRWYPISESISAWGRRPEIQAFALEALLSSAEFQEFRSSPATQRLMAEGYVRLLRIPVLRGRRLIASVTCLSRNPSAFEESQLAVIRALPVAKVLLIALHYLETDELRFRFDLVKDMFGCGSPERLAELFTERLAAHYGWKSVEVYWVDISANRFKLLSYSSISPKSNRGESLEHDLHTGLLGRAYQTGQDINVEDVSSDPALRDLCRKLRPATVSELCMPIRVDGRIKALLNVEDTLRNAFSRDEQQTLRSLLDEVGNLLGAAQTQSLIVQTFLATPSAVFVTDSAGTIIKVNPAAAGMLGYSEADLAGTKFYEHIMNAGDPLALLKPGSPETETVLRTKGGTTVPVLAGAHELAGFGAWVISAKDISYRKRLEQLEMLGQMYSELAAQMKTPLTLASGWLRRLRKQKESSDPDTADVLTQTLAQVKKLDITFERLALYDRSSGFAPYSEILLDLAQLVNRVLNQLPKSEYAKLVKSHIPDCGIYVRGDACQITFVIETILSNLFRFLPEDERLCLEMADNPQRVDVSISGWLPLVSGPAVSTDLSPEAIRSTLNDMALGEQVIARFMADHGGHYSKATADGGITRFELEFPRVRVEV